MDNQGIGVPFLTWTRDFSLLQSFQTGSGACPASFPGKSGQSVKLTTHPIYCWGLECVESSLHSCTCLQHCNAINLNPLQCHDILCTTKFNIIFNTQSAFMCFIWFEEQSVIIFYYCTTLNDTFSIPRQNVLTQQGELNLSTFGLISVRKGLVISTEEYTYARISRIGRHRYTAFFMAGCS
jgi:hypothetical protein